MRTLSFTWVLPVLFFTQGAWATFDITPITRSVSPAGNGATASYTLRNLGTAKTPVQITIVPRNPDAEGEEHLKFDADSDDQFTVYPSQVILKPKESQTVRVTWVGDPKVTSELSFRMISEELPVSIEEPGKVYKKAVGRLSMVSRYVGSLYVTPAGTQANLILKSAPSEKKKGMLQIDIENKGSAHQIIRNGKLKFISEAPGAAGKEVEVIVDTGSLLYNQNILAGKTRRFELPWPPKIPVGPLRASLTLPKE